MSDGDDMNLEAGAAYLDGQIKLKLVEEGHKDPPPHISDGPPLDSYAPGYQSGGDDPYFKAHTEMSPSLLPMDLLFLSTHAPHERSWLWKGWIGTGHVTSLYGAGGVGKSLLAMQLGVFVSTGGNSLGINCPPSRVLGFFAEDDEQELHRRLWYMCKGLNVSMSSLIGRFDLLPRAGEDNVILRSEENGALVHTTSVWDGLKKRLEQAVAEDKDSYQLLILDNIVQLFAINENRRTLVTQAVNMLTGLALEYRMAILLLGHPAKGDGSQYSGSTAWDAAVRARLYLERAKNDSTDELVLRKAKSNFSQLEEIKLKYADGHYKPMNLHFELDPEASALRLKETRLAILMEVKLADEEGRHVAPSKRMSWYLPDIMDIEKRIPQHADFSFVELEFKRMLKEKTPLIEDRKYHDKRGNPKRDVALTKRGERELEENK